MAAYYNDNDPFICEWLRELIQAGLIADGEVDDRSIELVQPEDLRGFSQCHFFAGIGGWSYALRLAGWPDDRPVWTGSCPCQPFSSAGKGDGAADPRHLWPAWFRLIRECRPECVFGEQVASPDGLGWFDRVSTDLEGADYAVGAVDTCAASVGAFHIRQRLYFVADAECQRAGWGTQNQGRSTDARPFKERELLPAIREDGTSGDMAHSKSGGLREHGRPSGDAGHLDERDAASSLIVGDSRPEGLPNGEPQELCGTRRGQERRAVTKPSTSADVIVGESNSEREAPIRNLSDGKGTERCGSPWASADWLPCRDGKCRPAEPGTFPLAHGVSCRVGRLRAYGNAIVPQVAQAFIEAYLEVST